MNYKKFFILKFYRMEYLPDELIQEIVESSPDITTTLARTSKDFHERIEIFAKRSVRHIDYLNVLKPSSDSWMITYKCMLDDRLMSEWGRSKTSCEKEEVFALACAAEDINEVKRIFSLGVDINIKLLTSRNHGDCFTPLELAIITVNVETVKFLLKYNVQFDTCCILEQINEWFQRGENKNQYVLILEEILRHQLNTRNYGFIYGRRLVSFHPVLLNIIMKAEILIPYGTKIDYMGQCNLAPCKNFCEGLFYCNGTMLCEICK